MSLSGASTKLSAGSVNFHLAPSGALLFMGLLKMILTLCAFSLGCLTCYAIISGFNSSRV